MVIEEPHRRFEIGKARRINASDIFVADFLLHYEFVQLLGRRNSSGPINQLVYTIVRETKLTNLRLLQGFNDSSLVLAVSRVEVVFDAVVGAPWELFGDVSPPISEFLVEVENHFLLFLVYRRFLDERIQVVVPPKH